MANVDADADKAANDGARARDESQPQPIPRGMEYVALIAGLIIAGFGFYYITLSSSYWQLSALAVCIGFGIILVAFGTHVHGSYRGWTVVGAGAMAIVLYLVLAFVPLKTTKPYVLITLDSSSEMQSVAASASRSILVGRPTGSESFRMVAFPGDLNTKFINILFVNKAGKSPQEFYIRCVDTEPMRKALDHGEDMTFQLQMLDDTQEYVLIDGISGQQVGTHKPLCQDKKTPEGVASILDGLFGNIVLSASAAVLNSDIDIYLRGLPSETSETRDWARKSLAQLSSQDDWNYVASSWNITEANYRQDLGRLVAWVSAVNNDRANAVRIVESLNLEQMKYIVELTGSNDSTMRNWSTEFLSWALQATGWPSGSPDRADDWGVAFVDALSKNSLPPQPIANGFRVDRRVNNAIVAIGFAGCNPENSLRNLLREQVTAISKSPDYVFPSGINVQKTAQDTLNALILCK